MCHLLLSTLYKDNVIIKSKPVSYGEHLSFTLTLDKHVIPVTCPPVAHVLLLLLREECVCSYFTLTSTNGVLYCFGFIL